jgi:hypothetical protein
VRIPSALTVAALVLVTGCGSHASSSAAQLPGVDSSPTGVDSAFWARADAACRPLEHWFEAHPQALSGFNPVTPTSASLRRFAVLARRIPLYHPGALTKVARLVGEPTGEPETWATIVEEFHRFDELTQRQTRDAARGDVRAWRRDYDVKLALVGKLGSDLYGAGIPDRNQCRLLVG